MRVPGANILLPLLALLLLFGSVAAEPLIPPPPGSVWCFSAGLWWSPTGEPADSHLVLDSLCFPVDSLPAYMVTLRDQPDPALVGETFRLWADVENNGNTTLHQFTPTLFHNPMLIIVQSGHGATIWPGTFPPGTMIDSLASGQRDSFWVEFLVNPGLLDSIFVVDSICLGTLEGLSRCDQETTRIDRFLLHVTKTADTSIVYSPDTVRFTVTVTNQANVRVDSIRVEDQLDPGLIFNGFDGAAWIRTIPYLDPLGSDTLRYACPGAPDIAPGVHNLCNQVFVTVPGRDVLMDDIACVRFVVPFLELSIESYPTEAEMGDIVVYTASIRNRSTLDTVSNSVLTLHVPAGFKYVTGTLRREGLRIADPPNAHTLSVSLAPLPPDSVIRITYRVVLGAGCMESPGITSGIVNGQVGNVAVWSNPATHKLRVLISQWDKGQVLIGKVFEDMDQDGWQSSNEPGIPGVEIWMEDGTRVVTDESGKFSIPDLNPGGHSLRIWEPSLKGRYLALDYRAANAHNRLTQFVDLTPGLIAKVNFPVVLAPGATNEAATPLFKKKQPWNMVKDLTLSLSSSDSFVPIRSTGPLKSDTLSFVTFGPGQTSHEGRLPIEHILQSLNTNPNVKVQVIGHADRVPVRPGAAFRNNQELSEMRAQSLTNKLVAAGVPADRIQTVGAGDQGAGGKPSERDRRVDVVMSHGSGGYQAVPGQRIPFSASLNLSGAPPQEPLLVKILPSPGLRYLSGSASAGGPSFKESTNGNGAELTLAPLVASTTALKLGAVVEPEVLYLAGPSEVKVELWSTGDNPTLIRTATLPIRVKVEPAGATSTDNKATKSTKATKPAAKKRRMP